MSGPEQMMNMPEQDPSRETMRFLRELAYGFGFEETSVLANLHVQLLENKENWKIEIENIGLKAQVSIDTISDPQQRRRAQLGLMLYEASLYVEIGEGEDKYNDLVQDLLDTPAAFISEEEYKKLQEL